MGEFNLIFLYFLWCKKFAFTFKKKVKSIQFIVRKQISPYFVCVYIIYQIRYIKKIVQYVKVCLVLLSIITCSLATFNFFNMSMLNYSTNPLRWKFYFFCSMIRRHTSLLESWQNTLYQIQIIYTINKSLEKRQKKY